MWKNRNRKTKNIFKFREDSEYEVCGGYFVEAAETKLKSKKKQA